MKEKREETEEEEGQGEDDDEEVGVEVEVKVETEVEVGGSRRRGQWSGNIPSVNLLQQWRASAKSAPKQQILK